MLQTDEYVRSSSGLITLMVMTLFELPLCIARRGHLEKSHNFTVFGRVWLFRHSEEISKSTQLKFLQTDTHKK